MFEILEQLRIALSSNDGLGKFADMQRLTRDLAACIQKVWM